jgi:hypothetical protein
MQLSVYHLIYTVLKWSNIGTSKIFFLRRLNIGTDKIFFPNKGLHITTNVGVTLTMHNCLLLSHPFLEENMLLGVISAYND